MSWPEEQLPTTVYRPWPIISLAVLLCLVGLGYIYDGIRLAAANALTLPMVVGFITGTVVCLGLSWGLWHRHEWARRSLVWLCVLAVALQIAVVPFLLFVRPAGTMVNAAVLVPGLLSILVAYGVLRYLGRSNVRAYFVQP